MVEISSATLRRMRKNEERVEKENKALKLRLKELEDGSKAGSSI